MKVAFSGFLLGNREKIAVVANADFSRRGGKMAEKMNRQVLTSNLQRDSKLQNAFGALVIGDSLVLGGWVLEVAREMHALPFYHSVEKSAFICEIHPPQYCPPSAMLLCPSSVAELLRREERTGYGGRVCGSSPSFKIKNPSQNDRKIIKPNQSESRVILPKKFRIFFGCFHGKSLENP
jgi:hypothetical protein